MLFETHGLLGGGGDEIKEQAVITERLKCEAEISTFAIKLGGF